MKLSPRDRRTAVLGLAGLLVIIAARLLVIPWVDGWAAAREQIAADRHRLDELQRSITRVLGQRGRLAARYGPAASKSLKDVEQARIGLLKAARDVLTANGLKPTYTPQPPRSVKKIPGVRFLPLRVRSKCNLSQLTKCLADMRNADTLIIVDRLSITNNEKKPGQLEMTMILATLARQGGRLP